VKAIRAVAVLVFCCSVLLTAAAATLPATVRLDYFHTGNASQEIFSVDRVVIEPLPWPGNPNKPIDNLNLGIYFFEVRDRDSGHLLFSRGYASAYGEWVTTAEAKTATRTFHESLRFPAPETPVRLVIKKRDALNQFGEIWSAVIDPKDKFIDRSKPAAPAPVIEIEKNGDPALKVDVAFLGEGYTAAEVAKCQNDLHRMAEALFSFSPFKERRKDFNIWGMCPAAAQSGVTHPSRGVYRHTLFGSTFDAFGTERYALSFDNRNLREIASFLPYDAIAVVMNYGEYGNGGIFGNYATVSADNTYAVRNFVHEFGHSFAALGDEYYFNANVAYSPRATRVEPWEPNITALLDPDKLKWKGLVSSRTPLPTPWPKDTYEKHVLETAKKAEQMRTAGDSGAEVSKFLWDGKQEELRLMGSGPYGENVGAYEGALYESHGYYRPQQNCLMLSAREFCIVCRGAIERVIDQYSRP
jgi:IgA Peptidase M64/Peptidase M64 N-terminus